MPEPTVYRYRVRYYIVDAFGSLLWDGRAVISQDKPRPDGEAEQALMDVTTARTLRRTAPPEAPEGRILIAAIRPA